MIQVKPERLPGPELDEVVHPAVSGIFESAVVADYAQRVPSCSRPRGWRSAVRRAARLMPSRLAVMDQSPVLPGVYPYGPGDTVVVVCSWAGAPARVRGVVLWGPAVLFRRVWVRVAGFGMVPASRVCKEGSS